MGELIGMLTQTRHIPIKRQHDQSPLNTIFGEYVYNQLKSINVKKVER